MKHEAYTDGRTNQQYTATIKVTKIYKIDFLSPDNARAKKDAAILVTETDYDREEYKDEKAELIKLSEPKPMTPPY